MLSLSGGGGLNPSGAAQPPKVFIDLHWFSQKYIDAGFTTNPDFQKSGTGVLQLRTGEVPLYVGNL